MWAMLSRGSAREAALPGQGGFPASAGPVPSAQSRPPPARASPFRPVFRYTALMDAELFHPATAAWLKTTFGAPTPAQAAAWPVIKRRRHALIAAPTGSGKTLAAFLAAIDELVRAGLDGGLADETQVLYVSPLKALSNDIQKNLQAPLAGIAETLKTQGLPAVNIRAMARTGDTPQGERERMRRAPPHILVTTPESLYLLLSSASGRAMLKTIRAIIIDEIHALAPNKRGAHLALSLERLEALTARPPARIGLSATQRPIEAIKRFLIGNRQVPCDIVDHGHVRPFDLALELPDFPLEAVMSGEAWQEVYRRLATLIETRKTTLVFVNTRRLAERAARFLAERVGEEHVTAHHGSLAREHRLDAEQRLKRGELKALVATASLELGLDIGDVELVCQLGSPRSIATFLQRVGRSGHHLGATPQGRLFPLSRDDLVECAALLDAVRHDELDRIAVTGGNLDVLAQQIVAETASREWREDELFQCLARAWPYRQLSEAKFRELLEMLDQGFSTRRGRRSRHIHYDAVNRRLRPRQGARLTALTNGGVIPDQFDYDVVLEPEGRSVGTLNEDFAFESLPGDIFQLGNASYRILKVEQGKVRVADAHGQPPNIPFWFGEAPGRTDELSHAVSRLRRNIDEKLADGGIDAAIHWLESELGLAAAAARQLAEYSANIRAALGFAPTQQDVVFERFFDAVGDQHLVVHSPYGARVNRAWGLALRKRLCRQFNFELQAAALDDSLALSLGATHSFPLEDATRFVPSARVRETVAQALLATPMFPTHWRWNASVALAVRRNNGGQKVPPPFQRAEAEDLMAVVFPDQLACQDNLAGEREIPAHPLVEQTINDCLHELMDIAGLENLLRRHERGELRFHCRDLSAPSPLAQAFLTARPYAFLDDAPAEERRARAVLTRRFTAPDEIPEPGQLSPEAIDRVREEAWPGAGGGADELHDALTLLGVMTEAEGRDQEGPEPPASGGPTPAMEQLMAEGRAAILETGRQTLWVCAERLPLALAAYAGARLRPHLAPAGAATSRSWERAEALVELSRGRLECSGPVTERALAVLLEANAEEIHGALLTLQNQGCAMQGRFTDAAGETEWCERGLLARIHRYTIKSLREATRPVSGADFMRFLFAWHGIGKETPAAGDEALLAVIARLEGFPIPAAAWEKDILPARLKNYSPAALDRLCGAGRVVWARLPARGRKLKTGPVALGQTTLLRNTPITLTRRENLGLWQTLSLLNAAEHSPPPVSATAEKALAVLRQRGASFFIDMVADAGLLRAHLEEALAELAANGMATSDHFAGLRALIVPSGKRPAYARRGRHRHRRGLHRGINNIDEAGRWALIAPATTPAPVAGGWLSADEDALRATAQALLRRYGVVFRTLLERESNLPPWRDLLYACRRLEARGELRGGRFVAGVSGEQFALPEAATLLQKQQGRELPPVVISATDPLNLVGILQPGERVPALRSNRILFKNGWPAAKQLNRKVVSLEEGGGDWEAIRSGFAPQSAAPRSGRLGSDP